MKKLFVPVLVAASAALLFTGCLGLNVGGGTRTQVQSQTLGQQLIDLQKARDAGAITEAEYQAQKAKLLASK